MGDGFPWSPPRQSEAELEDRLRTIEKSIDEIADEVFLADRRRQSELRCTHDIPLSEPCVDCLPVPPGDDEYWANEGGWEPPGELDGLPPRPAEPTGIPGDPPDKQGVLEDFLVLAGHAESDADWMPHGLTSIELAKTDLPEGYLDERIAALKPKKVRTYNTSGLATSRERRRQAQEDAAVQFVYDCTETVPGGRVPLNAMHARYVEWHKANDRPYISKDFLRKLLTEMGLESAPGRMPGEVGDGRPPILVHGVTLRSEETPVAEPKLPTIKVVAKPRREKHALLGAKPGPELPKQVRELIEPLVTEQGWSYEPSNPNGRGKPRLIAPDGKMVTLPTTPHLQGRTLENTRSFLKQNGARL